MGRRRQQAFTPLPPVVNVVGDEARPGIILDFDAGGDLVSIEILDASRPLTQADRMEFETAR